jgi:hypothetical protein
MDPRIQQKDNIVDIEGNVMVDLSVRRYLKLLEDSFTHEQVMAHNMVTAWKAMAIAKENENVAIFNKMKKLEYKLDTIYELFHQHKESTTEAFMNKRPLMITEDAVEDPTVRTFNSKIRRITPINMARPDISPGYTPNVAKVHIHLATFDRMKVGVFANAPINAGDWICSYDGIMEYRACLEDKDAVGNATFYDPEAKVVCFGNKVLSYGPNINQCPPSFEPNAVIYFDYDIGSMCVFATNYIRAHQEVYVNYGDQYWLTKSARDEESGSNHGSTTTSSHNA